MWGCALTPTFTPPYFSRVVFLSPLILSSVEVRALNAKVIDQARVSILKNEPSAGF
jgi:hypothetical protein